MEAINKVAIPRVAGRDPQRRSRASHSKTRTGCLVCRARRIKCDETRPVCKRCNKRQLPCNYPQPVHNALSILLDPKELRSLQFYRERTAHDLGGHFDEDFWTTVVLKLSYTNDTVQHFLIALGSLDESFRLRTHPLGQDSHAASLYVFSLQQYSTAIRSILSDYQLQSMPALILASCIACILYEAWLGSHDSARKHVLAARHLQSRFEHLESIGSAGEQLQILEQYLNPMLARNSHQFSIGWPGSGYVSEMQVLARRRPQKSPTDALVAAKLEFERLSWALIDKTTTTIQMYQGVELEIRKKEILNILEQWHERFLSLPEEQDCNRTREYSLLRMKYHAHRIGIGCAPYRDEIAFDKHLSDFKAIVDLCTNFLGPQDSETPPGVIRTHDLGTTLALNLVACSCRDPVLRREALRLLYRYPRLEGVWSSYAAGCYAERIMILEEAGLATVTNVSDVPARSRVRSLEYRYEPGCLAETTDDQNESSNPPTLTLCYTHPNSGDPSAIYEATTPLKRYHIASGFGDKSESWWPDGSMWDNSILNREVDEETRHRDGPFFGRVPMAVIEHWEVERQCTMTHLSLDVRGEVDLDRRFNVFKEFLDE